MKAFVIGMLVLILLTPSIIGGTVSSLGQSFDGAVYRNVFTDANGTIRELYTAINPIEQCFQEIYGGEVSSPTQDIAIKLLTATCDSFYGSQTAVPAILLLTPTEQVSCQAPLQCLSGGFVIQIAGHWGGTITLEAQNVNGVTISAVTPIVLPTNGYGYIQGGIYSQFSSDFIIRMKLVGAGGTILDNKGRIVHVVPYQTQWNLQAAESYRTPSTYARVALASVTPNHDDCLSTLSGGRQQSRIVNAQTLVDIGGGTFKPDLAVLYSDSGCVAQGAVKSYRVLVPPGGPGAVDWPYL